MRYRIISTEYVRSDEWKNQQVASFHDREDAIGFFDSICISGYVLDTLTDSKIAERR